MKSLTLPASMEQFAFQALHIVVLKHTYSLGSLTPRPQLSTSSLLLYRSLYLPISYFILFVPAHLFLKQDLT